MFSQVSAHLATGGGRWVHPVQVLSEGGEGNRLGLVQVLSGVG